MTKKLYLDYVEGSAGGEYEENGTRRSPLFKRVMFKSVYRDRPDGFFAHDIDVSDDLWNAERVFLVVVFYQDGDSLGKSHGNWDVWKVVGTGEEAIEIEKGIFSGAAEKTEKYCPWTGHFNRLENVEIHSFRIGKNSHVHYH